MALVFSETFCWSTLSAPFYMYPKRLEMMPERCTMSYASPNVKVIICTLKCYTTVIAQAKEFPNVALYKTFWHDKHLHKKGYLFCVVYHVNILELH
jgi:hypothetical protein